MNITIPISCKGNYKLVVSKDAECKNIVTESGVSPNLVLNSGFNIICREGLRFHNTLDGNASMRVLVVGSSNVEPEPTQTGLVSQVASVSLVSSGTTRSFSTNYGLGYIEMTFSRQFGQGAAAGNISEVGCGYSNTELLSRALVRDVNGNPATITVLSDEFLTVHYTLRIFFPKVDITQNINVIEDGSPIPTTLTIRPFGCDRSLLQLFAPRSLTDSREVNTSGFKSDGVFIAPTAFDAPNLHPVEGVVQPYIAGTFEIKTVISYGTSAANTENRSLLLWRGGLQPFQILFDPPLQKNAQQVMRITVGVKFGRPE